MSRITRLILVAVAAIGLIAIPITAIGATSLWDDVPDESIFVNDTNWMKITGVSLGCNPPLNTEYCPKEFMTREQMAALLRRLSEGEIVNAATAVDAERADQADMADDSDMVDGRDSDELMSITASNTAESVTFDPSVSNPLLLVSVTGFDVPADGGVITALANVTAEPVSGPQLGTVWIEIGGDGTCPSPVSDPAGAGFYLTLGTIIDTTSAMATSAVSDGTTRIDVCTAGLDTDSTAINAHVNVTWNPVASDAGVAASNITTWQDLLARFEGALDG